LIFFDVGCFILVGSEKVDFYSIGTPAIGLRLKATDRPPGKEDKRWIPANRLMPCAHLQPWPATASQQVLKIYFVTQQQRRSKRRFL
jgi:hypothetical protein